MSTKKVGSHSSSEKKKQNKKKKKTEKTKKRYMIMSLYNFQKWLIS